MANNNNGSEKAKADNAKATANKTASQKQSQSSKGGKKKREGLFAYLRGVRQEFRKVVWPTREELTTDTIVVIVCVLFFAVGFWLIDTGFLAALKGILGITLS
jgi:preprotein translocase subunit SecE